MDCIAGNLLRRLLHDSLILFTFASKTGLAALGGQDIGEQHDPDAEHPGIVKKLTHKQSDYQRAAMACVRL